MGYKFNPFTAKLDVVVDDHASLTNLEGGAPGEYNHLTDAELAVVQATSGSNTGDQTLPVKATGAELDTGTDDAKFATAAALVASHDVPSVTPGTSGNVLTSDGTDWTSASPIGSASFVSNEVPSGTVNGSNVTFTLVSAPVAGTLALYRDGQLMKGGGADYTLTTNSIAFVTAPVTGSVLLAFYQSAASTAGNADLLDGYDASTFLDTALTGWYSITDSWAYASADAPTFTITVPSGAASKYTVGMRVRLTQTTVKYFIITVVADTVLTVYGGTDYTLANAAISAISVSNVKAPLGFPVDPIKWTAQIVDTTLRTQATPTTGTWYNPGSISLSIPIGSWDVYYQVSIGFNDGSAQAVRFDSALSTANNSASDSEMRCLLQIGANVTDTYYSSYKRKNLLLAAKTTYYLNAAIITGTNIDNLYILGGTYGSSVIRAVCAYL